MVYISEKFIVVGSDPDLMDDIENSGGKIVGYFSLQKKPLDYEYLGSHKKIKGEISRTKARLLLAIDDVDLRKELGQLYKDALSSYLSPSSYISNSSIIEVGSVVYPKAYIGPDVTIGAYSKVSVGSQIHHGTQIGFFSVICPAVTILGNVRIGESVFVGAATTIGPKLKIGDKCMVGMSSVVTRDLPSQGLYFGTPAKLIRKTQN